MGNTKMNRLIMKFKAGIFFALSVLLMSSISWFDVAAQSKVGTTAASFLTIGTGARGSALGHAYTAIATGGDALFWNPAGAALRENGSTQLFMTNHNWFAGIDYNALGVVIPVGSYSSLGISVSTVNYGRMDITTETSPNGTGITFDANDLMMGLTYSSPLTTNFYFGFTGKYVRQTIWDMVAQTIAVDMGFILKTEFLNGLTMAGTISNFGGKMQLDGINTRVFYQIDESISESNQQIPASIETGAFNLPVTVRFGVAVPVIKTNYVEWLVLADAHQSNDNYTNADLGSQLRLKTKTTALVLRGGYKEIGRAHV